MLWVLRIAEHEPQGVMPRLFTGLEIPARVAQSLAMMRGGLPGARWIDPENYHLTLRFIGDIDDGLAREIAFMLGNVRRPSFWVAYLIASVSECAVVSLVETFRLRARTTTSPLQTTTAPNGCSPWAAPALASSMAIAMKRL